MKKVFVFDIDGTLFDTKTGILAAINFVLNRYGLVEVSEEEENNWIGPPVRESFRKFRKMSDLEAEEATKLYRKKYVESFINLTTPYLGMLKLLKEIRKEEAMICIATMKTSLQIEKLFSIYDIASYFDIVKTANLNGSKSKSDMLFEIKEELGNNYHYYMVGDTIGDYNAAVNNSYDFIAADYGYGDFNNKEVIKIKSLEGLSTFISF